MSILHIYDTTEQDLNWLKDPLSHVGEVRFTAEPLSADNFDAEAEVISIFVTSTVDHDLMLKFPNLKLIACRSTGFDHVDLRTAGERGITVVNIPSYGEHTVAEYTFGLLLALTRRIIAASEAFQAGTADHDEIRGMDLYGKTLGLIGTGRIGRNVATIAKGFGMNVFAFDTYPDANWAKETGVTYTDLNDILSTSDVITLHIPYFKAVHHLVDAAKLKLVKPTAILVNTARGELIDTEALIAALDAKQLQGAVLDVFEGESLVDVHNELRILRQSGKKALLEQGLALDVLRKLPNVLVTNHNAFNTAEALGRINQTTVDNITKFLDGQTQNSVPR
jgi:D-lactate dehydrogenase